MISNRFVKIMRILTIIVLILVNAYGMVLELPPSFMYSMSLLNAMIIYCLYLSGEKNAKESR